MLIPSLPLLVLLCVTVSIGQDLVLQLPAKQCYCPGSDYAQLVPELARTIGKMHREKAAPIHRLPREAKPNIPEEVDVLKAIGKFSNYNRSQLLDIDEDDLAELAEEAAELAEEMRRINNQTVEERSEKYEELRQQMEEFTQNMTVKLPLVEAAQEAVRDASEKRRKKRRGFCSFSSNKLAMI